MLIEDRAEAAPAPPVQPGKLPQLVGGDLEVPLAGGEMRGYVNLDFAASTRAMQPVVDAVTAFLPW